MKEPLWLDRDMLLAIHAQVLALHGGADGVRDDGLLDSALARPRQLFTYGDPPPDLCALAASYAAGIAKNHPFVDGNKRSAFVAAGVFLLNNGLELNADEAEAVAMMIALASSAIDAPTFAHWLRENV